KTTEFVGCEWLAEEIALKLVAPMLGQEFDLGLGFNPFGDDLEIDGMTQLDDRFGNRRISLALGHVHHEGAIDFETVHGKALQIAQRRIAGPEIVDSQIDADIL